MNLISTIASIIAALLSAYLIACLLRVLITWFGPKRNSRFIIALATLTDPWLKAFSKLKFLHFRNLDFSPVAALICLQLISQVFWFLAISERLSLGIVLSTLLTLLASAINVILVFFIVLTALRIVGLFFHRSSVQQFWFTLDHILQPLVYPLLAKLFPRRVVPYGTGLGIFLGIIVVLALIAYFGLNQLASLALFIGV